MLHRERGSCCWKELDRGNCCRRKEEEEAIREKGRRSRRRKEGEDTNKESRWENGSRREIRWRKRNKRRKMRKFEFFGERNKGQIGYLPKFGAIFELGFGVSCE